MPYIWHYIPQNLVSSRIIKLRENPFQKFPLKLNFEWNNYSMIQGLYHTCNIIYALFSPAALRDFEKAPNQRRIYIYLTENIRIWWESQPLVVVLCLQKIHTDQGSGDFWAQPAKIRPFTTSTGFFRIWLVANLLSLIWIGQYPIFIYKCRLISSSL